MADELRLVIYLHRDLTVHIACDDPAATMYEMDDDFMTRSYAKFVNNGYTPLANGVYGIRASAPVTVQTREATEPGEVLVRVDLMRKDPWPKGPKRPPRFARSADWDEHTSVFMVPSGFDGEDELQPEGQRPEVRRPKIDWKKYTRGARAAPAPAQTQVLHIAVARPSGPYAARAGDVRTYATDATAHMRRLGALLGDGYAELSGPAATRQRVAEAIRAAARAFSAGRENLFVLSFVGHGGRLRNLAEADGFDEAWGLDDNPLVDDELTALLAALDTRANVAIIANSCHAGGIDDPDPAGQPAILETPAMLQQRIDWQAAVAAIPAAERFVAAPGSGSVLEGVPERRHVLLAVCTAGEAYFAPRESLFTATIVDATFPGGHRSHVTYRALERLLRRVALPNARPLVAGPDHLLDGPAFGLRR